MQAENPDGKSAWKNQWKISGMWKIMSSPVRSAENLHGKIHCQKQNFCGKSGKSILSAENLHGKSMDNLVEKSVENSSEDLRKNPFSFWRLTESATWKIWKI